MLQRTATVLGPQPWVAPRKGLLAGAVAAVLVAFALWAQTAPPAQTPAGTADYGKLPLSFVPNEGQTDQDVRFTAQGGGYAFHFTPDKAALSLTKGDRGVALHLTPLGASPARGSRPASARRARSTTSWATERHTNLPTYGELTYRELWPGIDMVFRGSGGSAQVRVPREARRRPEQDPARVPGSGRPLARCRREPPDRNAARHAARLAARAAIRWPAASASRSAARTQLQGGTRIRLRARLLVRPGPAARDRPRPHLLDLPRWNRQRPGQRDRGRRERQRVRGRSGQLLQLPDHGRGVRHDVQRADRGVRHEAERDRHGDAPTRPTSAGRATTSGARSPWTHSAAPTSRAPPQTGFPTTAGAFDTTITGSDAFVTKLNSSGSALLYSTFLGSGEQRQRPGDHRRRQRPGVRRRGHLGDDLPHHRGSVRPDRHREPTSTDSYRS